MINLFGNTINFDSGFETKDVFNELVEKSNNELNSLEGQLKVKYQSLKNELEIVSRKIISLSRILRAREILGFDYVTPINRVKHKIDFKKRKQDFSFQEMFPDQNDLKCACGCGGKTRPKGSGKWKWYTKECQENAYEVYSLIKYGSSTALPYLLGKSCIECGSTDNVEYDHIQAIEDGGGASWFDNFQPLCKRCHGKKTGKDYQNRKAKYNNERLK